MRRERSTSHSLSSFLFLSFSVSLSLSHSLSHTLSLSLSHTLSLSLSLSLSLTHTHTHTHTLSPSLPPSLKACTGLMYNPSLHSLAVRVLPLLRERQRSIQRLYRVVCVCHCGRCMPANYQGHPRESYPLCLSTVVVIGNHSTTQVLSHTARSEGVNQESKGRKTERYTPQSEPRVKDIDYVHVHVHVLFIFSLPRLNVWYIELSLTCWSSPGLRSMMPSRSGRGVRLSWPMSLPGQLKC